MIRSQYPVAHLPNSRTSFSQEGGYDVGVRLKGTEREESFIFHRGKGRSKLANLGFKLVYLMHMDPTHGPGAYSTV